MRIFRVPISVVETYPAASDPDVADAMARRAWVTCPTDGIAENRGHDRREQTGTHYEAAMWKVDT